MDPAVEEKVACAVADLNPARRPPDFYPLVFPTGRAGSLATGKEAVVPCLKSRNSIVALNPLPSVAKLVGRGVGAQKTGA